MRMRKLFLWASVFATASLGAATQAQAQIVEYQGADPNAQQGSPYPNSSAASQSFDAAAVGTQTLVTFEQSPLGTFNDLGIAPGASISGSDINGNEQTIQNAPGCGNLCGFNTTPGGSNYVKLYGVR